MKSSPFGNPAFSIVVVILFATIAQALPRWDFESETDIEQWVPNTHLTGVHIDSGTFKAKAIDSDPFLLCRNVNLKATPYQYVVFRIKASQSGIGELFWSGQLQGQYGGLTETQKVRFAIEADTDWQEIVLFPFWHTEEAIRQLRLDLYAGATFEID